MGSQTRSHCQPGAATRIPSHCPSPNAGSVTGTGTVMVRLRLMLYVIVALRDSEDSDSVTSVTGMVTLTMARRVPAVGAEAATRSPAADQRSQ